jgi:FlaA1/EpsC-like NDP-sugar epimerase
MPVEEIIIAIPKLIGVDKQDIYNFYKQTGLNIKIYDFAFGQTDSDNGKRIIRDIKIEDLLFREPVNLNNEASANYYKGKRIIVTGGGGSIGSEICRQLAKCAPKELIILDIYENNAYEIQQELSRQYGSKLNLSVEIASVRDRERLESIFKYYKPQIVFHAAAHKHVPLMEHSPGEAIKNNVFGTYNTADMAEKYGAEKFIMISTDKAVNPTNVMGASKRMCEMIVQSRHNSKTSFAAVRFGNVLGSNGSVIPLFKKQIEEGGPVTVTDKRIIRYFMTIPEASQLVMQAGIMAQRGELFVLDMGKPVKIIDLAENMIRLSGFVPYKDIDIVEVGLRPGEKLYEELLIKGENLTVTLNKKIFIEKDTPYTRAEIEKKLDIMKAALELYTTPDHAGIVREAMKRVVESYKDPEKVNDSASEAAEMKVCYSGMLK